MLDSPSSQARLDYASFSRFPMSHATLPHLTTHKKLVLHHVIPLFSAPLCPTLHLDRKESLQNVLSWGIKWMANLPSALLKNSVLYSFSCFGIVTCI